MIILKIILVSYKPLWLASSKNFDISFVNVNHTVFDGKAETISLRSSMKCQITWTLECCLFNCWSQTGHFSPITTLLGFKASSCFRASTSCLSANSSSSRLCTKAICLATFCGFSPLKYYCKIMMFNQEESFWNKYEPIMQFHCILTIDIGQRLPIITFGTSRRIRKLWDNFHQLFDEMTGNMFSSMTNHSTNRTNCSGTRCIGLKQEKTSIASAGLGFKQQVFQIFFI